MLGKSWWWQCLPLHTAAGSVGGFVHTRQHITWASNADMTHQAQDFAPQQALKVTTNPQQTHSAVPQPGYVDLLTQALQCLAQEQHRWGSFTINLKFVRL